MNSKLHKQKTILTVSQVVDMVRNQDWRKDVSYILTEEYNERTKKWEESAELDEVSKVDLATLMYNAEDGYLSFETEDETFSMTGLDSTKRIEEIPDMRTELYRYTIYMT